MKKTDKKIDNSIIAALTEVCEIALNEIDGFKWLTHVVNYKHFPESLSVVCVFGTDNDLSAIIYSHKDEHLKKLIKNKLETVGIHIKNINRQVIFNTEEGYKSRAF
jgi:hypothetical protein